MSTPAERLRHCNRHNDCDAADKRQHDRGVEWEAREKELERRPDYFAGEPPDVLAVHCHAEDCEDCFGR